jgi:hypothetical protein
MRHPCRAGLLILAIALLAGCGDRRHPAALVGNWKLDLSKGVAATQLALLPPAQRQQAVAMAGNAVMVFGPRGELTWTGGASNKGTWEVEGRSSNSP